MNAATCTLIDPSSCNPTFCSWNTAVIWDCDNSLGVPETGDDVIINVPGVTFGLNFDSVTPLQIGSLTIGSGSTQYQHRLLIEEYLIVTSNVSISAGGSIELTETGSVFEANSYLNVIISV